MLIDFHMAPFELFCSLACCVSLVIKRLPWLLTSTQTATRFTRSPRSELWMKWMKRPSSGERRDQRLVPTELRVSAARFWTVCVCVSCTYLRKDFHGRLHHWLIFHGWSAAFFFCSETTMDLISSGYEGELCCLVADFSCLCTDFEWASL